MKSFGRRLVAVTLLVATGASSAATSCRERVTQTILHSNGNVYFLTSQTCSNWCQINWGSESKNRNALALLTAATVSGQEVSMRWLALNSCDEKNATYASPDYFSLIE